MTTDARLIQAVRSAARILASPGNFNDLIRDVLQICLDAVEAMAGTIYLHDDYGRRLIFQYVLPISSAESILVKDIPDDFGMAGQAFQSRATLIYEIPEKPEEDWNEFEKQTQLQVRSMIASPLMIEDEVPIGVVQLINKQEGHFSASDVAVLEIISSVATMAYLNYKLRQESARASTLLGMGKVGHDIGNLAASLYANLSYSDLAVASIQSQKSPEKMKACLETLVPTLSDLRESVDRLVGYSQLISDMSAGRSLRPTKTLGLLGPVIKDAAEYLEADANVNHIRFRFMIADDALATCFDPLYIFRIVQNLVGNAIKAVRDAMPPGWLEEHENLPDSVYGEIAIAYRFSENLHILEVSDCGAGMDPITINRILSGNAISQWDKAGGSGWGTKIVLELTAAHNGTVSIVSQVGQGSIFRVSIPQDTSPT